MAAPFTTCDITPAPATKKETSVLSTCVSSPRIETGVNALQYSEAVQTPFLLVQQNLSFPVAGSNLGTPRPYEHLTAHEEIEKQHTAAAVQSPGQLPTSASNQNDQTVTLAGALLPMLPGSKVKGTQGGNDTGHEAEQAEREVATSPTEKGSSSALSRSSSSDCDGGFEFPPIGMQSQSSPSSPSSVLVPQLLDTKMKTLDLVSTTAQNEPLSVHSNKVVTAVSVSPAGASCSAAQNSLPQACPPHPAPSFNPARPSPLTGDLFKDGAAASGFDSSTVVLDCKGSLGPSLCTRRLEISDAVVRGLEEASQKLVVYCSDSKANNPPASLAAPAADARSPGQPTYLPKKLVTCSRVRLSVRHGASLEKLLEYTQRMCAHLKRRVEKAVLQECVGWVPTTPRLRDCYSVTKEIGRGHFGVVRLCQDVTTRQMFASKTILKSNIKSGVDVEELLAEVVAMLRIQKHGACAGDYFVRLHEIVDESDAIHLVLDYCNGGDLFEMVATQKRLTEPEAANVLKQLLVAVQHMHSLGLVHRDLKPENILLETSRMNVRGVPKVRVADFGLCVVLQKGQLVQGMAGSPFYMAPEVVLHRPYTHQVDVWSLGALLYTCLSGSLPFWAKDRQGVFEKVLQAKPDFQRKPWPLVSQDAKALVKAMLTPDPALRPTVKELLQHPWLLRHCPELKFFGKQSRAIGLEAGRVDANPKCSPGC